MKLRTSLSIISFKKRAEQTWNLKEWEGINDPDQDLLFFGIYNDRDWCVFDNFKGNKYVLWAGTDITQVLKDYERKRILKNYPETKHYCENDLEAKELMSIGLNPEVIPSFLDDVNKFTISFKPTKTPHIFICGHDAREEEYGLGVIKRIAPKLPDAVFHVYGISKTSSYFSTSGILQDNSDIDFENSNVRYHGKVSEEQFNEEIKNYHCGLRTNEHDGFSDVVAKSILLGQYPITKIPYDKIWSYTTEDELVAQIEKIKTMTEPNIEARDYYLQKFNKFPWLNEKK
jgi:hypothetical protein